MASRVTNSLMPTKTRFYDEPKIYLKRFINIRDIRVYPTEFNLKYQSWSWGHRVVMLDSTPTITAQRNGI